MRRPTDRAEAWATWRQRLAGERVEITSAPHCGWFKARRNGCWTAVQIDLVQSVDDEGCLIEPERFVAFVGADVFYEEARIEAIWLACAKSPISEEEAERLLRMPQVSDLSRQVVV